MGAKAKPPPTMHDPQSDLWDALGFNDVEQTDLVGGYHPQIPQELIDLAESHAASARLVDAQIGKAQRYARFYAEQFAEMVGGGMPQETAETAVMFCLSRAISSTGIKFLGPNPRHFERGGKDPRRAAKTSSYEAYDLEG